MNYEAKKQPINSRVSATVQSDKNALIWIALRGQNKCSAGPEFHWKV
jgi:hypothetical protein